MTVLTGNLELSFGLRPSDKYTQWAVKVLVTELGLQNRETSLEAASAFLQVSQDNVGCLLDFPHDKNYYTRCHATYTKMRKALVKHGYIALVQKGGGRARTLYVVLKTPQHDKLTFTLREKGSGW